ncbi:hypothetical protein GYA25_01230 [Candidatus Woesearchaeota archaeon]|jgi:hypothetical protein|nr:hypothetical protein [Candidatus Woesearchaeota archaeon]
MKKRTNILLIVSFVLIILVVVFLILTNQNSKSNNPSTSNNLQTNNQQVNKNINEMVDCGKMENPNCFMIRMNECLPVKGVLTGTDGSNIEISILGIENNTCHFQRRVNNILNLNCFFPKETMNWDTIDQTFGNDHGLQSIVDSSCNSGW